MLGKYALIKVIKGLLESEEISLRELARRVKVGSGTAKIHLDYLFKNKFVTRKVIGRNHLYKLDKDNVVVRQMRILCSLFEIQKAGIVEEILERYEFVLSVLLYGSVAKGLDDFKSDIDILIITRKPLKLKPLNAEKKIGREVTFVVYTLTEWRRKAKEDKVFYDNIILNSISLYGEKPVVL